MRKHHNKLYFGKYTHKATFAIPHLSQLYPTTDFYLQRFLRVKHFKNETVSQIAEFILQNRPKMKFRLQNSFCVLYGSQKFILEAINLFWKNWVNITSTDPLKTKLLDNNVVVCKRLPLGKYQYQVHTKRKMFHYLTESQKQLLYKYLTQNNNNATITNRNLKQWLSGAGARHYDLQGYFYIKDEKALTPIYMISNKIVDRVTKFVKV